jgi:hypothetical protein
MKLILRKNTFAMSNVKRLDPRTSINSSQRGMGSSQCFELKHCRSLASIRHNIVSRCWEFSRWSSTHII